MFLFPRRFCRVALSGWLLSNTMAGHTAPGILITNLPAYGSTDNVAGLVRDVDPMACRVAVFIYVPAYGWVTKPTCAQPLTDIQRDGRWTADITTGGVDTTATRVAAFLVRSNYSEPCVQGAAFLTNIYPQALASTVVTRPAPGVRWLSFSGYDWWVKSSAGQVGPGPNFFSNSTNNVWLDSLGQLHLRITQRSNQWQCAELVSARTFGHGSYRFELASRVDNLDPNVVLGLFTWSDDPAYTHREIDVECSRWSNAGDTNNAQFVVQPWEPAGHLLRYAVPTALALSTHCFTWRTNVVTFQCQRGGYTPNPSATNLVRSWTYTGSVPQTGDENVRFNLWLNQGHAPADGQESEVIIKRFQFVPLGAPPSGKLSGATMPKPGLFEFVLNSVPDWRYQVQTSADLSAWIPRLDLLATNTTMAIRDSNPSSLAGVFYRAWTLP